MNSLLKRIGCGLVLVFVCFQADAAAMAADCNSNGIDDVADIAEGTSFDCDQNGVPDACQEKTINEDFDSYILGQDPVNWFDTGPGSSTAEADNFSILQVGSDATFGTFSAATNLHSHFVGSDAENISNMTFTGRVLINDPDGGIGVTFLSQFTDQPSSNYEYLRIRRANYAASAQTFHLAPPSFDYFVGSVDSGVNPTINTWYRFRIIVETFGPQLRVKANFWEDGQPEPAGFQIDATDPSGQHPTAGTFGVWSMGGGGKFWDDFEVHVDDAPVHCDDGDSCTFCDVLTNGMCTGLPVDCSHLSDDCNVGTCVASNGYCQAIPANQDGACDDMHPCTVNDSCDSGVCQGVPMDCSSLDSDCAIGFCNSSTGECETTGINEGEPCEDSNPCTTNGLCASGLCVGDTLDCSHLDNDCQIGVCRVSTGLCGRTNLATGTPCDDLDPCTINDSCMVGSCEGEPRDCSHLDVSCLSGWCDPLDGQCVAPEYDDCNSNFFPDICEHYTLFSPQKIITADADGATSAIAADLDNDGDLDVLAACQFADELTWYENTDGKGTFGLPRGISTEVDRPNSVFAADLDGDGDLDVLSASLYDDKICWYENMDGIGEFGAQQIISTSADSPYSVFSIDIDGDGDFDVLSASSSDDKIAWYENTDGNGQFGPQQVITSSARGARSVFSTDIDGDGDADVLSAARNDWRIAWYANTNGLGGFGPQQTISGNTYRASAVFGTDLDGDGDTDVISAADFDGEIAWHENLDGHGDFGPQKIIYSAADFAVSLFAADLDKDGDTDVLSASRDDDKIAWYENRINEPHSDADGFSNPTFLSTTANGASSVFAADLNGDGNLDVLSASYADDKIAWYENSRPKDCNNNDILDVCDIASGTSTDCDASAVPDECELGGNDCNLNAVLDACDIAGPTSTDCDNNDLPDECQLVGNDCNSNGVFDTCDIVGFESLDCNADGIPDECQLANNDCNSNNAPDECDLAGATSNDCNDNSLPDECELANNDCNHNGTPDECDVIATFNDESGPLGPFGIGTSLVYTAMAPPRALGDVTLEFTANLNFGIFDPFIHVQINNQFIGNVLRNTSACSVTSDQLVLTPVEFNELVGGDNVAIKMVPIGNIFSSGCGDDFISVRLSYVGANDCNMNDVPDDCDVTNNDCNLNGIPDDCDTDTLFSPQQVISTSADHAVSVFVEDLNGDGNLDVLSASYADRKIAWYENMNSSGAFGPEQIITTNASYARAVSSADLDGDGDADVLVAAEFDNMIAWHDNIDGLGSFGPQRVITANAASAQFAFAADLDGDGDNDVLSASADDDKIAWYENVDGLGTFGIQQIITTAAGGARSVFAEDLDGDGDLDVLSASASENEVAWYENTDGLGSFGVPQEIYPAYHATSVIARDLDGDGDADVLWAAAYSDQIAWSENTDGLGSFGPRKNISLNADFAQTVFAADMDGDGDIDVLSASQFDGKIAWYENTDGLGEFGPEQIINAVAGGAQSVFAADLDNDGDVDVLSASTYEDKIAWYENTGNDCNGNLIPDACESDTDGDGLIDVCDPCIFGAGSGDSNGNGMLELDDFTDFELCLIGPDRGLFTGCECFDFDSDGDNDLIDFGAFQSIYTDN